MQGMMHLLQKQSLFSKTILIKEGFCIITLHRFATTISSPQPYHPAAQDWFPTEAKQGWAGQFLDGRPPEKTSLLLEEVLVSVHPVVCVGPNAPV